MALFTDESVILLNEQFRKPGERYSQCEIRQMNQFGRGSVMVWTEINWADLTELVVVSIGSMTALRYGDNIIVPIVEPYAENFGPDFILMQNNATIVRG